MMTDRLCTCMESNEDVLSVIYDPNGNVTHGEIVMRLNELARQNGYIEHLEQRIKAMNEVFVEIRMAIGGNGFCEPIEEPDPDCPWLPVGLHLRIDEVMERENRE